MLLHELQIVGVRGDGINYIIHSSPHDFLPVKPLYENYIEVNFPSE